MGIGNKKIFIVSDILPLIAKDTIIGFCNKEGEWLTHDCHYSIDKHLWFAHHGNIERPLTRDLLEGKVIEIFKLGEDIVFCIEQKGK